MKRDAQLRIGIVGAGLMGRWHGHAARQAGAHVSAVIDTDRRRAEVLAARHRDCLPFDTLDESMHLVDVVHLCTPTESHTSLASQALAAGRHVLVEKPLGLTSQSTEELLALAESRSVMICPVHQFLFQDGVLAALQMVAAIEPLQHIDITICSAGADGIDPVARDRIASEILPHPLSILARVLPGRMEQLEWSVRRPAAGEIRAMTQDGAITVSLLVSMSVRPTINRLQLLGGRGTVHADLFHGFAFAESGAVSRRRKLMQPFTYATMLAAQASSNLMRRTCRGERAYPGLRTLVAAFYSAVAGHGNCPIAPGETLAVARAYDCLRAQLAAAAG